MKGFTLIEVLVAIAIIVILCSAAVNSYFSFRSQSDLNTNAQMILNALTLAQSKTLASEGASSYGVHFEQEKCVLFKGDTYNPAASDNKIYNFSSRLEIPILDSGLDLNEGGSEAVFARLTGNTSHFGTVKIQLKNNSEKYRIIKIESSGEATIKGEDFSPLNTRITDSRHTHFVYSRNIDTVNEIITLTFDDPLTTEDIKISDFIEGSQFNWEGTITVGTDDQLLHIHTHRLNNPDTLFSIHRDLRYNNKGLTISISGEAGSLIIYNPDSQAFKGTSIFTSEPELQ
ncbi:type II secretion system protein [Candidatus Parcubacteria bacterium]|nr:type II secretion system protein [Candidatus Parcubacteria bacterium]